MVLVKLMVLGNFDTSFRFAKPRDHGSILGIELLRSQTLSLPKNQTFHRLIIDLPREKHA
jgi:hypothetical protein